MKLANNPYDAYQQGRQEEREKIIEILKEVWLEANGVLSKAHLDDIIKQIKEGAK